MTFMSSVPSPGGGGRGGPADDIVRLLPRRWHAQFRTEYLAVLDAEGGEEGGRDPDDLLHRWRLRATAYADPAFEAAALEAKKTPPGDLTALPGLGAAR